MYKLMNHAILAPPYLTLKSKFADMPIKDVSGVWQISLIFRNTDIYIIHEKKAMSGFKKVGNGVN
jgi:hypothetical protein